MTGRSTPSPATSVRYAWRTARHVLDHPANADRRWRQLARATRFQLRGRLRGRRTVAPLGARSALWAELHVHGSTRVLYANPPYWEAMHVWARTLRPGDRFVDVGANVGAFSLWAAEHGARVLALEPATDTFARLMENVELNDYPIDARRLAVAARPGTARLTVGLDDVNHLLVSSDAVVAEEVEVTTLDALIGGERVAGVKIDVEGAERLVLEGATEALGDRRIGLLQLEWNSSSLDLLGEDREPVAELLRSTGYELLAAEGNGRLRPLPSTRFRDDVFARPRC